MGGMEPIRITERPQLRALLANQHGLATFAQAQTVGVDYRDLRRLVNVGDLMRIAPAVYAERAVWDSADDFYAKPLLRIRAGLLRVGQPVLLSHDSSALVQRIWLPDSRASDVHFTRKRVLGLRNDNGIKHHGTRVHPDEVTTVDGFPVLGPARTAVDIAREHGLYAGVAATDCVRRTGTTMAELERILDRMRGWPQTRVARAAIEMSDPRSESYLESVGRVFVAGLGIGTPEPQFGLDDGTRTAWCDLRVGRHLFEFDGAIKYFTPDQGGLADDPGKVLWKEKRRQDFLTGFKLGLSRFTYYDMHAGQPQARARALREYAETTARWGTSIDDLAPYLAGRRPA